VERTKIGGASGKKKNYLARGKLILNVLPLPTTLSAFIIPWCASTIVFT
jgi:hypothetical protein